MSEQQKQSAEKPVGNIMIIAPVVSEKVVFHYRDMSDLKNLIAFVGRNPIILDNMNLKFKKVEVCEGDYLVVNKFGEVTEKLTEEQMQAGYELKHVLEYSEKFKNKVEEKTKKVKQ